MVGFVETEFKMNKFKYQKHLKKSKVDINIIYCGDCKDILKKIPDNSIDLIYLDPPFFSQKHYEDFWTYGKGDHPTKMEFSDKDWEKVRMMIDPTLLKEYEHIEERWKGGHKGIYVYIAYMRERLEQCERVLKDTGTIYLHCDWHASHYLKVMMDGIFGYNNLRNEIIWCYRGAGYPKKDFGKRHDTIFRYSKSENYTFNLDEVREEYAEATVERFKHYIGNVRDGVDFGVQKLNPKGRQPDDWWQIQPIAPSARERLGYPTQKPEALMEKIILASSNKQNIVLDPFCGCGTTLAVAKRLGRQFIGIDISRVACDVTKKRLGNSVKVIGGETSEELAKMNPHEFARLIVVEKMGGIANPKKSGDMGIDGWIDFKTIPVQVKNWGHKVGRPEIDKFKTAVERDNKNKGIMVANDFSKDCYSEVVRIEKEHKIKIELRKVDDIFK